MNLNPFTPELGGFNWLQLDLGLLLAVAIASAAYFTRNLSRSGAVAAAVLGTAVFGLGGLPWAVLLLGFFLSSSLLSRLFKRRKVLLDEKFSKGSRRDAAQVLANGGAAGLLVLLQAAFPHEAWPWLGAAASLAAANADTWATELGVLSPVPPRLITTLKKTEPGASGAVSLTGTLAAAGGALLISILALLVWPPYAGGSEAANSAVLLRLLLVALAGLGGSLIDSLLGATVQAIYRCPACNKETERHPLHTCGAETALMRGSSWLNNDGVNAACTVSGALIGVILAAVFSPALALQPVTIQPVSAPEGAVEMITSPAFANGESIPAKYTCKGADISPPLSWQPMEGAQSYALIVDDPDAPMGVFTHWVIYNLPADLTGLPEGVTPDAYSQGRNSFGRVGYNGPCPPPGKAHRYNFTLLALDLPATLPAGLDKAGLLKTVSGHVLAQSVWMGTFKR